MDSYVQPLQDTTSSSGDRHQHPKYRGVRKRKWGKWVSEIRQPNSRERVWLGSYETPDKAARAFDAAQYCLRGRNAQFNFPDSLPDIPVAPCLSQREIQAVAARFANDREDGEGLIAARTDTADGASYEAGAAGSSECGNMGWPFLDKWFDDDRIFGGIGYMGSIDLQCSDHWIVAQAEDSKNDREEDVDLHGPSFLWNF